MRKRESRILGQAPRTKVATEAIAALNEIKTAMLNQSLMLVSAQDLGKAKELCKEIIFEYPGTEEASQADMILRKLKAKEKKEASEPGNLRIALLDHLITSELVESTAAGRLVVIRGKVRNDYPEPRNFIMVKGTVYSKDGKPLQRKTVYCGNTLSDTELQTLDKAAMDTRLRNKFGDKRCNFNVVPGKAIPFVVVFFDLPEDLGEFSVSVVRSDREAHGPSSNDYSMNDT